MALTQTIALLGLVLKDDNLLALAVFHHGGVHGSAFHHGGAELGRVAQDGQDLVKLDGVTGFLGQLLDEQNVAFRDLILLSAGLLFPLSRARCRGRSAAENGLSRPRLLMTHSKRL